MHVCLIYMVLFPFRVPEGGGWPHLCYLARKPQLWVSLVLPSRRASVVCPSCAFRPPLASVVGPSCPTFQASMQRQPPIHPTQVNAFTSATTFGRELLGPSRSY